MQKKKQKQTRCHGPFYCCFVPDIQFLLFCKRNAFKCKIFTDISRKSTAADHSFFFEPRETPTTYEMSIKFLQIQAL